MLFSATMGIVCNKGDTTAWHTASPYGSRAENGPDGLNSMFDESGAGADPYAKAPPPRRSGGAYDPGKLAYAPPTIRTRQVGDAGSHRNY